MGFSGGALAQEGKIRIGNISIISGLALQEEYDDNIYLGNGNDPTTPKVSDWITHLRPSLIAKYDMMERGSLSLGYTGDFAYYSSNTSNNWASNGINFIGDYKAPVGLIVGISNSYVNSNDPYSSANQYRLGQTVQRWVDTLQTKVGYEFSDKYRILAFYNYSQVQYDQDINSAQNYYSNEVGVGAEMRVMP